METFSLTTFFDHRENPPPIITASFRSPVIAHYHTFLEGRVAAVLPAEEHRITNEKWAILGMRDGHGWDTETVEAMLLVISSKNARNRIRKGWPFAAKVLG